MVSEKRTPLQSAKTSEALGLVTLNAPQEVLSVCKTTCEYQPLTKETIMAQYVDVFHGLGCLPGEYHLEVDTNVISVKHALRRVAIPLRNELKKHIEELEKMEVLKKVTEPTDKISSHMFVRKEKTQDRALI